MKGKHADIAIRRQLDAAATLAEQQAELIAALKERARRVEVNAALLPAAHARIADLERQVAEQVNPIMERKVGDLQQQLDDQVALFVEFRTAVEEMISTVANLLPDDRWIPPLFLDKRAQFGLILDLPGRNGGARELRRAQQFNRTADDRNETLVVGDPARRALPKGFISHADIAIRNNRRLKAQQVLDQAATSMSGEVTDHIYTLAAQPGD